VQQILHDAKELEGDDACGHDIVHQHTYKFFLKRNKTGKNKRMTG
jgi:hypothetical protein